MSNQNLPIVLIIDNSARKEVEKLTNELESSEVVKNIGAAIDLLKSHENECDLIIWHLREGTLSPYETIEEAFNAIYENLEKLPPEIIGVSTSEDWHYLAEVATVIVNGQEKKCFEEYLIMNWTAVEEWLSKCGVK